MDIRQLIRLLEDTSRFNRETFCHDLKIAYADAQRSSNRKDVLHHLAGLVEAARFRSRFLAPDDRRRFLADVDAILGVTHDE